MKKQCSVAFFTLAFSLYAMALDQSGKATKDWSYKADKVTVFTLDNGQIADTRYFSELNKLVAFLSQH